MKKIAGVLPKMTKEAISRSEAAENARKHNDIDIEWREYYKQLKGLIPQEEAYIYTEHQALNVA